MKYLFPSSPFKINLWRIAILLALLGAWQALSGPVFDKFWLSRPSDIALSFMTAAKNGTLLSDILVTFHSTALGFLYGLISGLVLGLVLAQSEAIALVLKPFILAIYGIPRIALAPVFILWFGIGLTSKVMMAALATFLLVFFNTYEGVRSADIELRNVARVLGASGWRLFWYVTLPNASPWIIAIGSDSRMPTAANWPGCSRRPPGASGPLWPTRRSGFPETPTPAPSRRSGQ